MILFLNVQIRWLRYSTLSQVLCRPWRLRRRCFPHGALRRHIWGSQIADRGHVFSSRIRPLVLRQAFGCVTSALWLCCSWQRVVTVAQVRLSWMRTPPELKNSCLRDCCRHAPRNSILISALTCDAVAAQRHVHLQPATQDHRRRWH